jgi:hypothetical protein
VWICDGDSDGLNFASAAGASAQEFVGKAPAVPRISSKSAAEVSATTTIGPECHGLKPVEACENTLP